MSRGNEVHGLTRQPAGAAALRPTAPALETRQLLVRHRARTVPLFRPVSERLPHVAGYRMASVLRQSGRDE